MADDIESKILRYKSRLQNSTDEGKLQETLLKIADLPITVDILQRTKIGKVINGLRKRDGDLGFIAKSIVSEWKSMVARVQAREEEEENDTHTSERPNSSPEAGSDVRSPVEEDQEEYMSDEIQDNMKSSHEKRRIKEETKDHIAEHASSHSKSDKHRGSDNRHREKDSRHSSSRENKSKNKDKTSEDRREHSGESKKSSSSDKKHSTSECSSKNEQSKNKDEKKEDVHKSHKSHSKSTDSKSNSENGGRKESRQQESKHSESRHSSKDSSRHSSKDSSRHSSKDSSRHSSRDSSRLSSKDIDKHSDQKHGHSSQGSHKNESRHLEVKDSSSDYNRKDKTQSRHTNENNDVSKSHSKYSGSGSNSKSQDDRKTSLSTTENCDKSRQNLEHSSSKDKTTDLMRSKRPKHTLSESDSENSEENAVSSSPNKVLGQWDGLSSDAEKNEEPGGFFFNDEYVDHEALLDDALNKYHMAPLVPKRESDVTDRKSQKRSLEEKGGQHADGSKRRRTEKDSEKSGSHREKDQKEDSKHRSHSSSKSKSSSSSKSSSHKRDGEDKKSESKKSRSKNQSKEPGSFEDCIAAVPVVKKPKADPNYEKLKSKFKIKKKGEESEKSKTEKKSKPNNSDNMKISAPPPKLKLSQRDLASLVRSNAVPNFRPIEETLSAASQFDDSLIGQKSYAKTMVYSGKKNTLVPKVFSLQEICLNVLMNHIDSIEAVGPSVPYYLMEPVLKRCTPSQLYRIEDFNPHFLEESDQLWKLHCEKEFKGSEPDEFESYRELYLRMYDEKERKLKQIKDNISQSMAKAVPERTAKLAYVDSYVKPPRDVRRQQLKYGTAGPSSGERAKKFAHLMDPIAIGRKEREERAVKQKAPMMQKTMMMLKKMRR
ncbi:elongin-A [Magallana gigas]|uniref:elongin-A n=1 Tax=Magallana gigas TaxID=29159 RepID=UPI003341E912